MTNYKFSMLHLKKPRLCRNHSYICHSTRFTPPTNYIVTLVKPFSFIWYVIPLLKTGALVSTRNIYLRVDNKKTKKKLAYAWPIACIGHNTCLMAASSGFYQSPGPPPLGNACGIVLAHCRGHWNGQQSRSIFLSSFCLVLPWWLLGQYGASSCLMVVSSCFQGSPGHAALGPAICIAPANRRGHQNGQWRRCICPSLSPLLYHNT